MNEDVCLPCLPLNKLFCYIVTFKSIDFLKHAFLKCYSKNSVRLILLEINIYPQSITSLMSLLFVHYLRTFFVANTNRGEHTGNRFWIDFLVDYGFFFRFLEHFLILGCRFEFCNHVMSRIRSIAMQHCRSSIGTIDALPDSVDSRMGGNKKIF